MREKTFDEKIKSKLTELEIQNSSPDWSVFKTKMEEERFDSIFSQKLNASESVPPPMNWERFKTKMDDQNSTFDQKISEKIKELQSDVPPMNWERMKSAIDDDFDEKVVNLVEESNPTIQENHWPILRDRLRQLRTEKKKVYKLKVLESLIAILLVVFLFNNGKKAIYNDLISVEQSNKTVPATDKIMTTNHQQRNTSVVDKETENLNIVEVKEVNSENDFLVVTVPNSKVVKESHEGINTDIAYNNTLNNELSNTSNSKIVENTENNERSKIIVEQIPEKARNIENKISVRSKIAMPAISKIENDIALAKPHIEEIKFSFSPISNTGRIKSSFIEAKYGFVENEISSPYDTHYRVEASEVVAYNHQFSILVGKRLGDLEYFTGLKYGSIGYSPRRVVETVSNAYDSSQNFSMSLDRIKFDNISLPVGIRYLKQRGRHTLYGTASINTHVITYTNYQVNQYTSNSVEDVNSYYAVPDNTILLQKNFHNGIFMGGSLTDNIYYTVGGGLGYRFDISSKFSFVSQFQYNHHILSSRLGPNRDRIYSINTDIGIRYRL